MGTIRTSWHGPSVAVVSLDNPPMNPLDSRLRADLLSALDNVESDNQTRVVVLTGAGPAFCAGEDLKEAPEVSAAGTSFMTVLERLEAMRIPVVAAINGWCIGGGFELAVNCDIRIGVLDAKFVCAGVNVGLLASAYRLPRLIGVSRAKAMLLTGSPFDAGTMLDYGFLTEIHDPDELMPQALLLAERIASRAPLSVEATKEVADRALDMDTDAASKLVHQHLARLRQTDDHIEAVTAFRNKREPRFKRT